MPIAYNWEFSMFPYDQYNYRLAFYHRPSGLYVQTNLILVARHPDGVSLIPPIP